MRVSIITDLAANKTATESAPYKSRAASLAVDGNNNTCAMTSPDGTGYSWWQVDLGSIYAIYSITVYTALPSDGKRNTVASGLSGWCAVVR